VLLLKADLQLANDALVPFEQYSVGGQLSVRGYRQDNLIGDNGFFSSVEIRTPILRIPAWKTTLQITPFKDYIFK
jgi:hemolysin activation/secretion protein